MAVTQINGATQIQSATITNTQIASAAAIATSKLADSANFILRGGSVAFTADQSHGGFKVTNLGTPTVSTDATTKAYVDAAINGLDWKQAVRAATTANGTLATAFANGSVIDGVTLVTGDRILLKNQTTGADNGLYVVAASGAPTRATDADTSAKVLSGMAVFVSEGTANADTQWALTTNDPITLATTALVFAQIGSATAITADEVTLHISGGVLSIKSTYVGQASIVTVGTLTGGATGAGFTVALTASTVTGTLPAANMPALTGDITTSAGAVATTADPTKIPRFTRMAFRETPSGTINGSTTAFTLANTPVTGTESVYLNGILQDAGAGNDYTISGAVITMLTAPLTGDKLRVNYFW